MSKNEPGIVIRSEWTSPSNIALIKYWGKYGNQLAHNPSLSLSLNKSFTRTVVTVERFSGAGKIRFFFEGMQLAEFEPKIERFINKASLFLPFLKENDLIIESWNSFPHSAGIASSASSMSALALCLCDISKSLEKTQTDPVSFYRKASSLARLGSGSASRSVYGGYSIWGKFNGIKDSSDEYAVPLDFRVHPVFSKLSDTILIVNPSKKKISSSEGHQMMETHPYAAARYQEAEKNLGKLILALKSGNTEDFIRITENEALGLHSLMLSSDPGFLLMDAGTVEIIKKIRNFRAKTGLFLCFTLDAGPNVHLLYSGAENSQIKNFIETELIMNCRDGLIIYDEAGEGPTKIS